MNHISAHHSVPALTDSICLFVDTEGYGWRMIGFTHDQSVQPEPLYLPKSSGRTKRVALAKLSLANRRLVRLIYLLIDDCQVEDDGSERYMDILRPRIAKLMQRGVTEDTDPATAADDVTAIRRCLGMTSE